MPKIIRIDTAYTTVADPEFGQEVVRFTYDDLETTYASVGAFPSKEILVRDATASAGFIPMALASARGKFKDEPQIKEVEANNNWTPLWVDNTLRRV